MKVKFAAKIFWIAVVLAGCVENRLTAQVLYSGYSIGTISGKYSFSYNETPDQLVELNPPGIPNTGFTYQWKSSPKPTTGFVSVGTGSSYSFSEPLAQTTYFLREATNSLGTIRSNIIKISVVSVDWEDLNYIRENDVITTGITDFQAVDQLPIGSKLQTTSYLDGLGRPVEKMSREMATPATSGDPWGDLVQFNQYDAMGREPVKYLPYSSFNTAQTGKYKTAPLTDQPVYYTSTYNETSAFSSISFDNSPLNRITNVKEPGAAWAAAPGNSVNYGINGPADNVQIFSVDYVQGDAPVDIGPYPANALYKLTYTDENGKQVIEYKTKSGQLILKKVQLDPTPSAAHAGWICTYSIYDDFGLLRYQIQPEGVKYLDANSWSFAGTNGQTILNEQCFQYNYDDKGRMIWKKAPGAVALNMIYDSRDRVVFTQDGNQAAMATPQWTVSLYDALDRPVISALYTTSKSIATLQGDIANAATVSTVSINNPDQPVTDLVLDNRQPGVALYSARNSIDFVSDAGGDFESGATDEFVAQIDPAATQDYSVTTTTLNNPISAADLNNPSVATILKYLFYDDYSFAATKTFDNGFTNLTAYNNSDPNVQPIVASARTLSMTTGSMVRVLGTNNFLASTQYYDEQGRHIQSLEDNIRSGTDITTLQYHFDGRLLSTCSSHTNSGAGYTNFITLTKYVFDKIGRVVSLQEQFGSNPMKTLASFDYDDMGRIKTKHLDPGYTAGGNADLESLDYSFNIHNQITGINKDYALKTSGVYNKWGHFFGMYLGFDNRDNVFSHAQLNGQVTGQLWNTQGDDAQRKYDYTYDNAGRLINAAFNEQQHPADGWSNSKMDFSVTGTSGQLTYDYNGNLLTMLQKGVIPGTPTPITVDDLRYAYSTYSNKLQSVTDQMTMPTQNGLFGDFKDGTNASGTPDYVYDNDGNVVVDLNKNVQSLGGGAAGTPGISYNFLDKPEQIRIVGKGVIKIVYSADGEKLQRIYTPETGTATTTTYINQFVYQSSGAGADALTSINFEEGRIRVMTPVSTSNSYGDALAENGNFTLPGDKSGALDYFIMDYQQNVRMILTEETHSAMNVCTMETGRASAEDPIFGQPGGANEVETTRIPTPSSWSSNTSVGSSVSRLGNLAGHTLGPNVLQKVMAGDQVSAQVQYYYDTPPTSTSNNLLPALLSSLAQAISGGSAAGSLVKGNSAAITSQLNGTTGFVNFVQPVNPPGTTPQAYLTILFFDERFNFISEADGGAYQQQVAATVTPTSAPLALTNEKAPKNGYVCVYVSNRSDQHVYFDNLKVGIAAGNIIEENHYYAYGLKIAAISSKKLGDAAEGKLKNPYQYNGKEMLDEDADLNWYDYGFRNYDPQTGRFMQLDPLTDDYPELTPYQYASCDPVTNIDVDGLEGGISTWASGAEDVFHNTLDAVTVIGHPVSAASKTASGLSTASRIGLIVARGASDALANANTIGLYDLFGGNHTSSYEDPQDQAAYLRGRLAGDITAGAQATTEINAGGGAALATAVETGGVGLLAGGVVALHGAGVGAIATADAAKTLKLLYQLNITAKDGSEIPKSQPSDNNINPGGTQTNSKTLWKGKGKERLDVENPNPTQRPGQIHYQDNANNKYIYDSEKRLFRNAPKKVNDKLKDPAFKAAIDKGLKYLGIK